jgi:hypothetical protein
VTCAMENATRGGYAPLAHPAEPGAWRYDRQP